MVLRAIRGTKEIMAIRALKVSKDIKDFKEHPERKVTREIKEVREAMEHKEIKDHLDHRGIRVKLVSVVQKEIKGQQDRPAQLDRQELKVRPERLGMLVQQGRKDRLVLRAIKELRV
jgi:hypothetical protein